MRVLLVCVVAGAFFLLNPWFVVGGRYSFGLPEIEDALAGTWQTTVTREGDTQTVTFRIEPATAEAAQPHSSRDLVTPAGACGNRTLIASASACIDVTSVPLRLIALDGSTLAMSGHLVVNGTEFHVGDVLFERDDVRFWARIDARGTVQEVGGLDGQTTAKVVHTK